MSKLEFAFTIDLVGKKKKKSIQLHKIAIHITKKMRCNNHILSSLGRRRGGGGRTRTAARGKGLKMDFSCSSARYCLEKTKCRGAKPKLGIVKICS